MSKSLKVKMNNIHFGANFIGQVPVKKKNIKGKFETKKVSLILIDTLNKNDILALKHTGENWKDFATPIYEDAKMSFERKARSNFHHILALTEQTDNFEKLQPDKLLAESSIMAFPSSKKINIDEFQVKPEYNYFSPNRKFKQVGTALLDAIKKIFQGKEITLRAVSNAVDFYSKNDFRPISADSHEMHYFKF